MKLYIEVLIIFVLMTMFVLWKLWYMFTTKRLIKKYNPEDNVSRKPGAVGWLKDKHNPNGKKNNSEDFIRRTSEAEGRESSSQNSTSSSVGLEQSQGRGLLPTATSNVVGEAGKGSRVPVPVRQDKKRPTRSRRSRRRFG